MRIAITVILAATMPIWGLPYVLYGLSQMVIEDWQRERRLTT